MVARWLGLSCCLRLTGSGEADAGGEGERKGGAAEGVMGRGGKEGIED